MRIAIIGPGIMPIPPKGWGAVEALIWDYYTELTKIGHEVLIVNEANLALGIKKVNDFQPDFVHLQYDDHLHMLSYINCDHVAATSHYAYLDQPEKRGPYTLIFDRYKQVPCYIFALSESIRECFISELDINPLHTFLTPNGAREDSFRYVPECELPDRTIYLAKIDYRKRQYLFQGKNYNIDFVGNLADTRFNENSGEYLGEWAKSEVYNNLTKYANMALLSDGEAHSLSLLEGMMAGLGLVISEYCTANLDISKPFIDVIPESKIMDKDYVHKTIFENREKSVELREDIREYALENFTWKKQVQNYDKIIKMIVHG